MTDDIVTRLRVATVADSADSIYKTMTEAADEIERLRIDNNRLFRTANESVSSLIAIRHTLTDKQKQLVRDLFGVEEMRGE